MGHRPAPGGPHAHAVAQPRSPVSAPDVALRSEGPRVTPGSPAQGPSAGKRRPHDFQRGKPVGPPTGRAGDTEGHRSPRHPIKDPHVSSLARRHSPRALAQGRPLRPSQEQTARGWVAWLQGEG